MNNRVGVKVLRKLRSKSGQVTAEYAILVGVLLVVVIIALVIFHPFLLEQWTAVFEATR